MGQWVGEIWHMRLVLFRMVDKQKLSCNSVVLLGVQFWNPWLGFQFNQIASFSLAEPRYLASASYMMDSSLSEEMNQFDFSTGLQSFSYNSQNPTASSSQFRRKVTWFIFSL